jgi:hypothetical protein
LAPGQGNENGQGDDADDGPADEDHDEDAQDADMMDTDGPVAGEASSSKAPASAVPAKEKPHISETRFASIKGVSPATLRALSDVLKYEFMTTVQDATLPIILSGKDVLAKAKTGTGKVFSPP